MYLKAGWSLNNTRTTGPRCVYDAFTRGPLSKSLILIYAYRGHAMQSGHAHLNRAGIKSYPSARRLIVHALLARIVVISAENLRSPMSVIVTNPYECVSHFLLNFPE